MHFSKCTLHLPKHRKLRHILPLKLREKKIISCESQKTLFFGLGFDYHLKISSPSGVFPNLKTGNSYTDQEQNDVVGVEFFRTQSSLVTLFEKEPFLALDIT